MTVSAMAFFGVTQTTGSFVYGKCWPLEVDTDQDLFDLKLKGCIVESEENRICCPFETCPEVAGIICK